MRKDTQKQLEECYRHIKPCGGENERRYRMLSETIKELIEKSYELRITPSRCSDDFIVRIQYEDHTDVGMYDLKQIEQMGWALGDYLDYCIKDMIIDMDRALGRVYE